MKKLLLSLLSITIFSIAANDMVKKRFVRWQLPIKNETGKTITIRSFKLLRAPTTESKKLDHTPASTVTIRSNETKSIDLQGECAHFTITKNGFLGNKAKAFKIKLHHWPILTPQEQLLKIGKNNNITYCQRSYAINTPGNIDWSDPKNSESNVGCDWVEQPTIQ